MIIYIYMMMMISYCIYMVIQLVVAWICCHILLSLLHRSKVNPKRPPPGPFPLPVIGNLLSLGDLPPRSLMALSAAYGPVISLRLGSLTTVVVSSAEAAMEALKRNDVAFSTNRQIQDALTGTGHHEVSVVFLPAGPHWRKLRKICNSHVFSTSRLDASKDLRKKKVEQLIRHVEECCDNKKKGESSPVNIGLVAFSTSLNLLSNTFFSTDLAEASSSEFSMEFKELVETILKEVGKPNLADIFPLLKPLDPQGVRSRIEKLVDRLFQVFDKMIDPRLEGKECFQDKDVLDALLSLYQGKEKGITLKEIKHLLADLFIAGTDTTSVTIEWAMTELLRNPDKLNRVQAEIRQVIGKGRQLEEADITGLPYLQAVVKETLRLHPSTPFLIPRKVDRDLDLCGFTVPKNAQVFVNVWAIGRDPLVWEKADVFEPERFLGSTIDYRGRDFELIPFGAGRRICPGMMLAHRMLHLVIGSLLNDFDWKLPGEMKPEELDMGEKFGLGLQKAQSLCAIPIRRP